MVGTLVSFWDGFLAGAMLVSGRVHLPTITTTRVPKKGIVVAFIQLASIFFANILDSLKQTANAPENRLLRNLHLPTIDFQGRFSFVSGRVNLEIWRLLG